MHNMKKQQQKIIESALKDLSEFLKNSNWFGREHEVITLFVLKFLRSYTNNKVLRLSQISIESSVQQIKNKGKKLVNKDLVIWETPYGTVWDQHRKTTNIPLYILEWKVNNPQKCIHDIKWLKSYTAIYQNVIGYSCCAYITDLRGIEFWKIQKSKITCHHKIL